MYYILYTIYYILYTIYYILYTIYYTILYYTILYYTILYYTILYYTILYYTTDSSWYHEGSSLGFTPSCSSSRRLEPEKVARVPNLNMLGKVHAIPTFHATHFFGSALLS